MNGYCNQCENHCAANALRCGRGYRAIENGEGLPRDAVLRPGMEGGMRTLPVRPFGDDRRGFGGHERFGGDHEGFRGRDDDRRSRGGFHGQGAPNRWDEPRGYGGGPRNFGGPGGRDGFDGHDGYGGPGGGHGRRGPGGPGMPPHGGRPPFGRGPQAPDASMLRERIEGADLAELMELAGRLMHHRPGAGGARGQGLILAILSGRESLSQRELQQMLGVQPGSMSEIVSKLERKGLVTREKADDRRGNLLRITEAGKQAASGAPSAEEDELFSALDEAQRDTLAQLLRKLLVDWAGRLGAAPGTLPVRPPETDGRPRTLELRPGDEGRIVKI